MAINSAKAIATSDGSAVFTVANCATAAGVEKIVLDICRLSKDMGGKVGSYMYNLFCGVTGLQLTY